MVTKVYCDHCGHAAPNAKKYIFGSHAHFFGLTDPVPPQATTGYINPQVALQTQLKNQLQHQQNACQPLPVVIIRVGDVDLCDHCQIIWMNRVRALTQDSEP